ncbi:MAG TPA: cobalamin-independent methionine synthase II family protein [Hyphomicrobiales bacterium]|nr:cobalamin-independent methionine synthase II family protein [Hyphomicrobiales bacterium]
MKHSLDRILTTHVGSLIRPEPLVGYILAKQRREPYDRAAYEATLTRCVADVVREQARHGIDVVSDGEYGKAFSWSQYILDRISGFEPRPAPPDSQGFMRGADRARFAEFYAAMAGAEGREYTRLDWVCTGPVKYVGMGELKRDLANFKAALAEVDVAEAFLPVAAPSSAIPDRKNEYYPSDEACMEAIADALRDEYRAIVDAGFVLQIDDARAAVTYDRMVPPGTLGDFRHWLEIHVAALNRALDGIPEDRIRYHVCWGSWPGPHTTDVPARDIIDLVLQVKAGAYSLEMANPRHEHEWRLWEKVKLPPGKLLLPGVISHATNVVEHPDLVAERIVRLARLVGRENVIASTDCGFAQGTATRRTHPSIMWAKLDALVDGARIASKELWG